MLRALGRYFLRPLSRPLSLWVLSLVLAGGLLVPDLVAAGANERRLLEDLLTNYQRYERPVDNESKPLEILFSLSLQQIIDLDERNQILVTNVWLDYTWTDVNLRWNATDYGGVRDVRIPPDKLWTPDVLMYNSASQEFDSTYPVNIVVDQDGKCNHVPPGIFTSTCKIDITWFPFDDQECELKFGSWTYHSGALNITLTTDSGDTSTFQTNGEWELLGFPALRNERFYICCPDPYLDITYTLKIRRRTLYYFSNLILPCVLIASMAVIGFYFPPESGEKVTLEITILMSLTFFMNVVSDMQPPSSETPLLGTYFSCIMILVASSVVCTILVINCHHRLADSDPMPQWIRILFLQWIPWLLRMSRPGAKITRKSIYLQNKMRELEKGDKKSMSLMANILDLEDDFVLYAAATAPKIPSTVKAGTSSEAFVANLATLSSAQTLEGTVTNCREPPNQQPLEKAAPPILPQSSDQQELQAILREIRVITDKIRDEEESSSVENEWRFAAMVLDRVCLIAFTFFTLLLSAAVFLAAPHVIVW